MRRSVLGVALVFALVGVAFLAALLARPYVRAVSFVVRSAGQQQNYPWLASLHVQPYDERDLQVPTRFGPVRAKAYLPAQWTERAVLLVPGVNALAIDEPRLVGFARALAASGFAVVTPEVADLKAYVVTPKCTDTIEDAAVWLATRSALSKGRSIGLMGISFAGGLALSAASRPSLVDKVAYVFSFGGHADFQRVVRYLCTGEETVVTPDEVSAGRRPGRPRPTRYRRPHDYGVAVLVFDAAHLLVPGDQVAPLKNGILKFLEASHLALYDTEGANREFAHAVRMEDDLAEPSRTILHHVNMRNVKEMGRLLIPHLRTLGDEPAVSPAQAPPPRAPVFLIHGTEDNVVPATETLLMAEHLQGRTKVRWLLSPLISHAEIDKNASRSEIWKLIRFWAALLRV